MSSPRSTGRSSTPGKRGQERTPRRTGSPAFAADYDRILGSHIALLHRPRRQLPSRKLVASELARDLVEDGVHHAGLLTIDKGMGDIDIFGNDHAAGHVLAMFQLVSPCPQHRAQDRIDPLQRPAFRQRVIDDGIQLCLVAHHARHNVAEEGSFRRQVFLALDLVAEPMALELGENVVDAGARDIHLVQRLHGGEPRRPAAVGFAVAALDAALGTILGTIFGRFDLAVGHHCAFVRRRLIRSIASAARAASPPLLSSEARALAQACSSLFTVRMPLPIGNFAAIAKSINPREDSIDTISKWIVSPLITQPSAIAASYGLPPYLPDVIAIEIVAGISSAPGTVMTS